MLDQALSRRNFIRGGLIAGTAAAGTAIVGCAPKNESASGGDGAASADSLYPEAEDIAPVAAPETWDDEVDVVVVGMGGGGISSALYCAEAGLKVIALEKEDSTGGATQHACGLMTLPGTSKAQQEIGYGYPEPGYDRTTFLRTVMPHYDYTASPVLLDTVAVEGGKFFDWFIDHGAPLVCRGAAFMDTRINNFIQPAGMYYLCRDFTELGVKAGVDLQLRTECIGLVKEDDRITGVQVQNADGTKFYKANKGVILCTGAFGMNKDMLAKYCPTALNATVGGPFPWADGRGQRMAFGAGADISGFDSFCCWEAYPERGDGEYWTFHWDGSVIACRQPWLTIDKLGNRCTYYAASMPEHAESYGGAGDYLNAATQLSRSGGREYVIMDADYEKTLEAIAPKDGTDRAPLTPERVEASGIEPSAITSLCSLDWHEDWNAAIERGDIKKADTLEELAEQLGLAPDILVDAVEKWNDMCDRGVDDDPNMLYPYNPEWLIKLTKPPYYGAKIGGGIGKTMCGPRVDEKMRVIDKTGHVIPGLYAHFMTAGGIVGEGMFNGTIYNTTIYGGNALSWVSGFMAAEAIVEG